ncbi:kinase-like protein [Rickenella mellea]|uniref:Kinase-like protein n=1 Tax=Rickenella mellea TaxID=50990 RepID=A0A4Y7Q2X3_9AGAM|nr:kinase-like protein [Rickenella mellea]
MKPAPAPYRPAPTPQPVSPNVIYRPVSQSQPQLQSLRSPPAPPQLASNTINNPMSQSSGQFQSIRPAPAPPQALNAIDRSMSQSPGQFQPTRPAPAPPRASNAIDRSMSQRPNTPKKPLEQINSTSLMERKQQQDPLLPQILPSIQQQQQQPQEPLATKGSLGASSKSPSLVAPAGVGPHERDRERQRAREHGPLQEKRGAQILSQTDVQRQQTEPILRSSSLHMPLKTPVALAGEGERELERARERERDLDWQELERDHQKANRGDRQSEPPTAATAQSSPPATAAFDMNTIQRIAMTVLDDREVKKKFLAMSQSDPIPVANLFQTLLDQDDLPTQTRSQLARSLARLAKSSRCYPDCLTLTTIRRTGTDPVAGGGFADVWKGFFAEEPVALKALRIYKHSIREKALKEFSHEAVIWRQLKHPNILPFYGVFTGDEHFDRLCLVSPWMDAGNAIDYLNVHPDGNRLSLLSDVAQGLKYLHLFQPPIIHGDLKGANIFVSPSFTACLGDFGLARFRDSQESTLATTTGNMTGTLRWQAPELLNTVEGESTRRSEQCDIYSFGCVCLELMTGKPPFSEIRIDGAVMMAIAKGQIPQRPLENAIERGLDDTLWDLMQQCWNFDPALRPRIAQVAEYFQGHRGAARLGTVTIEDITHRGVRVSSGQHGLPDRFVSDLSNLLNQVEGDVPFV